MSVAQSEPISETFVTVKPERAAPELPPESSTARPSIPLADSASSQQDAEDAVPPVQVASQDGAGDRTSETSASPEVEEREGSAYEDDGDLPHNEDDEDEGDAGSFRKSKKLRERKPRPRQTWSAAEDAAFWRGKLFPSFTLPYRAADADWQASISFRIWAPAWSLLGARSSPAETSSPSIFAGRRASYVRGCR